MRRCSLAHTPETPSPPAVPIGACSNSGLGLFAQAGPPVRALLQVRSPHLHSNMRIDRRQHHPMDFITWIKAAGIIFCSAGTSVHFVT